MPSISLPHPWGNNPSDPPPLRRLGLGHGAGVVLMHHGGRGVAHLVGHQGGVVTVGQQVARE